MPVKKHQYEDRYEIEVDGEIVATESGSVRRSPPSDETIAEIIDSLDKTLEDANIGNPQREAYLKMFKMIYASMGHFDEVIDHD